MRGVTLAAAAFIAALVFCVPPAEAGGCQQGGQVFSVVAPQQQFVQQRFVHQPQAFVQQRIVRRQAVVASPFVSHRGLNVVAPGVRLNVGQPQVQFRRRIPPFNLLLGPRPVFR